MTDWGLWGAPEWAGAAMLLLAAGIAALLWTYWHASSPIGLRTVAAALKLAGLIALALCLVEPLVSGVRPRPGANLFVVAVDNSQSLRIRDARSGPTRGEHLREKLLAESSWQTRLGQDFDVRRFTIDEQLRSVKDFGTLDFSGEATEIASSLGLIERRYRGLPLGGVLLVTDGNLTDTLAATFDWSSLPPIYPVVIGSDDVLPDVSVERVSVQQTNFEAAPVTIHADIRCVGGEQSVEVSVLDEASRTLETQTLEVSADREVATARFQIRPKQAGIQQFQVSAAATGRPGNAAQTGRADEAIQANNTRSVMVDNGKGPYRVLYVSGRPNWDFKFLRRALAADDQLELVGLVRIARQEPKFTFRRRGEGRGNQLFEGFNLDDEDTAEQYDEPVLTRLGTTDEEELRDGFPKSADALYEYDAIVLDDIEAAFFSQDQLSMIESFVSRRGGGLLMMGGVESFIEGGYRRTSAGDLLPVYLDRIADGNSLLPDSPLRLVLTREGWLQDWVRLKKTEDEEVARLAAMPTFKSANRVGSLKPGAIELAQVADVNDQKHPALVAQRFGRGRTAALLVADLWRWGLRRADVANDDLEKSWRQTIRWLVADVPRRVEVEADTTGEGRRSGSSTCLRVRVHDAEYLPLENAIVKLRVAAPDGRQVELAAEADDKEAGVYVARHPSRTPGPYRADVTVIAPDGSAVGERQTGWVAEPLADEFNRLRPNRELLAEISDKTGGEVLDIGDLDDFVAGLDRRTMPVTETWIHPLWHHPAFFLFAIACLIGEWGLRRWKGLA